MPARVPQPGRGLQRAGRARRSARGRGAQRYGLCAARAAKLGNRRVYGIKHLKQMVKCRCRVIRFNQKQSSAQSPRRGSRRSSAAGEGWEPSSAARTALSRPKPGNKCSIAQRGRGGRRSRGPRAANSSGAPGGSRGRSAQSVGTARGG